LFDTIKKPSSFATSNFIHSRDPFEDLMEATFPSMKNEQHKLIVVRKTTGWHMCTDYRKLIEDTQKDHFPLPFIDHMLEKLANISFYCFLDDYSGYLQIPIDERDQEKTTFTCSYGTFAYRRIRFGICNAPATFQRCMVSFFSNLIENCIEIFMRFAMHSTYWGKVIIHGVRLHYVGT